MAYSDRDRLIALAGIYQSAWCVTRIAGTGTVDTQTMEPCIHAIFQVDSDSVAAVFGPPQAVASGARQIAGHLTGQTKRDMEMTRYVVSLIKLEGTLSGRQDMLKTIGGGIEAGRAKLNHFALMHPNMLAHLGDLYSTTLSRLQPRIMVRGTELYLQNPDNQNRIRALLLGGVRAAMLWRQVGGKRRHILLSQRSIAAEARAYLKESADA